MLSYFRHSTFLI